ncbi:MAG: DNA polymerase IV [Bacillota bacterium]|nr:DNA polymerase IV [Bacillota bacterium]
MDRVILHSYLNGFYASVECLYRPELRDKPIAVGGDEDARHGIILAKNELAKKYGVQTGEPLWKARQKCPDIIFVPANFDRYLRYSKMTREIYEEYSPKVQAFGLDEAWIDVTGSTHLFGNGEQIANQIRKRVKFELGVTVSVGVSFNKIFAKLGSDMKKPDATTVLSRENFKEKVWRLNANELLYIGRATSTYLKRYGIYTIGDVAKADVKFLNHILGKNGDMLWSFANGLDNSPVTNIGFKSAVKSVGNSTTTPKDLLTDNDVRITFCMLAESVAARLREQSFKCKTLQIYVRDNELNSYERQGKFPFPLCTSADLAEKAFELFTLSRPNKPIRSLGIRACDLVDDEFFQLSFMPDRLKNQKEESLEYALDDIRYRFGNRSVLRGLVMTDKQLSHHDPKDNHKTFPVGY